MASGLQQQVALVTGASQGLGEAIVRALAAEGVRVALCARRAQRLEELATDLRADGAVDVAVVPADLREPAQARAAVAETVNRFGRLDILVNNAGTAPFGRLEELSDEDLLQPLRLKPLSYLVCARAAAPVMRQQGGGCIINIAGGAGKQPAADYIMGAMVNAGVLAVTKALSHDLGPAAIRVNAVSPGAFDSPRFMSRLAFMDQRLGPGAGQQAKEEFALAASLKRLGEPAELASAVVFLASPAASYITGINLAVDGGRVRSI